MKHENAEEGYNKPTASWTALMESPETSACKCTRFLLFSAFPPRRHLTKWLFTLATRNIERSWENARYRCRPRMHIRVQARVGHSSSWMNILRRLVTLTSKSWHGESPGISRNDGEIIACDRIPCPFFLSRTDRCPKIYFVDQLRKKEKSYEETNIIFSLIKYCFILTKNIDTYICWCIFRWFILFSSDKCQIFFGAQYCQNLLFLY